MSGVRFLHPGALNKHWQLISPGGRSLFTVIGMNSIAACLVSMFFSFHQIGNIFVGSLLPRLRPWDGFVEASAGFAAVWLVLYWMYRTRTFLKV
jgi:hypothetical protein